MFISGLRLVEDQKEGETRQQPLRHGVISDKAKIRSSVLRGDNVEQGLRQ